MSKVTIIGRGLDPSMHLSLAGIEALKNAEKVLGIESEKKFWTHFQNEFKIQSIDDISYLYQNNEKDTCNYQRFVNLILELSLEYKEIALLVQGHPRFGVSFINMLKQSSPEMELNVIEGISSFDVMLNYLEIDPLESGTAIIDANRLILFKYMLEPALCYFIYHICSVGNSRTNYLNPADNNYITLLKDYLLNFYPKDKIIFLCRMSTKKNQHSEKIPLSISDLDKNLNLISFCTTLFIPSSEPKHLDFNFLSLLRSS